MAHGPWRAQCRRGARGCGAGRPPLCAQRCGACHDAREALCDSRHRATRHSHGPGIQHGGPLCERHAYSKLVRAIRSSGSDCVGRRSRLGAECESAACRGHDASRACEPGTRSPRHRQDTYSCTDGVAAQAALSGAAPDFASGSYECGRRQPGRRMRPSWSARGTSRLIHSRPRQHHAAHVRGTVPAARVLCVVAGGRKGAARCAGQA